jgi:hypothetical protein
MRILLDSVTGQPVPFALITNLSGSGSVASDEKGAFTILVNRTDSIKISHVSYTPVILARADINDTIYLIPAIQSIEGINLKSKKKYNSIHVGPGSLRSNTSFGPSPEFNYEIAQIIKLPASHEIYRVEKILIPVVARPCWGKLIIKLYRVDSCGLPGPLIFVKQSVPGSAQIRNQKLMVDIAPFQLLLKSDEYLAVSIGWPKTAAEQACHTSIRLSPVAANPTFIKYYDENDPRNYFLRDKISWEKFNFKNTKRKRNTNELKPFYSLIVDIIK